MSGVERVSATKILLLGADGQVGWELQRSLSLLGEVVDCDVSFDGDRRADFAQPESLRELVRRHRPGLIVNAAAHTAVDKAESEPELVGRINATAPGVLAQEAATLSAWLGTTAPITCSTAAVTSRARKTLPPAP